MAPLKLLPLHKELPPQTAFPRRAVVLGDANLRDSDHHQLPYTNTPFFSSILVVCVLLAIILYVVSLSFLTFSIMDTGKMEVLCLRQ